MPAFVSDPPPVIITAARNPVAEDKSAASVTIIDRELIASLGEPAIAALIRLTPSAAVGTSGPAGSLTDIRIRGAEANHTLLFIDGIRVNDPASGDIPRFELVNADIGSRIEVVRGPQSALWGSDAVGGVVAINGLADSAGFEANAEAGSFGSRRGSVAGGMSGKSASLGGALAYQSATGIDSFGSPGGDKDGFRNLSGRVRATIRPLRDVELGASALALTGRSEFDGYNLATFVHEDTLDSSRNRLAAGRLWAESGSDHSPWRVRVSASLLGSSNSNYLAADPINRTSGTRQTVEAQAEHRFTGVGLEQRLTVAAEGARETFRARDQLYGGATDQDRSRTQRSLTAEWRGESRLGSLDLALRRDLFNRFRDSTTLRAAVLGRITKTLFLTASYGEGIAPPTFFDLYGFFPGNFVGNPSLKPESSGGFELGLRFKSPSFEASLTGYRQRLENEIVDVYDPVTYLQSSVNRGEGSRRAGLEFAARLAPTPAFQLMAAYSYLDATQPDPSGAQVIELRRPRHSGSITAWGRRGKWHYGASLAYVGTHRDVRDSYPFDRVRLAPYWLADARLAYRLGARLELFARAANLFDSHYQDSAGYRTEGRGLFGGISLLRGDRRSSQ